MKRDELQREIRRLVTGCGGCEDEACDYCLVCADGAIDEIMERVDRYTDAILVGLSDRELWPASRVAQYRDLSDDNSARAILSHYGIRAVKWLPHPVTGRPVAFYPADEVRALPARKATTR